MLREEPALNPAIPRAFRVPDASCDSFDLLTALGAAIQAHGGTVLTYHEVTGLTVAGGQVTGATLRNVRTGEERHLAARDGRQRRRRVGRADRRHGRLPGDRAAEQGHDGRHGLPLRQHDPQPLPQAGRRRHPRAGRHGRRDRHHFGNVPDPNETGVQAWEVRRLLEEGEKMVPGFSQVRALRAWAGVRPLYEEGGSGAGARGQAHLCRARPRARATASAGW